MRITFLGTGAATGVPLPFCRCGYCNAAREQGGKNFRRRSSLLINRDLLIDLGPDVGTAAQEFGADLTELRWCLQTHAHSDHFDPGIFVTRLAEYAVREVPPLSLVASAETFRAMSRRLSEEEPGVDLLEEGWQQRLNCTVMPVRHGETVLAGSYQITALDSLHDPAQGALIYLIEQDGTAVLYGTDLSGWSERCWEVMEDRNIRLDWLILDQTYGAANGTGHLNARQVARLCRQMQENGFLKPAGRCYATHLSHEGNPPHEQAQRLALQNGYEIAYDGLVLEA